MPLCFSIVLDPLIHVVNEEASPALFQLTLLEEDLLGNGVCLHHDSLLVGSGEEVQKPLVELFFLPVIVYSLYG
jgi:hypothetical protein